MSTAKLKKKQVVADVIAAYKEAQEIFMASKRDASRIKFLRPSQLPFCPTGFFIQHATMGMVSTLNLLGTFYTSVGTTVHEVVQKFMGPGGKLLADWKCPCCGKWKRLTTDDECPKCGISMDYHEVLIDYKGVVGHIDAIFKDRHGRYWILDFKTCTVSGAGYKKKSPGKVYIEQVETYALMLYLQYGIKVEGCMLQFIPRDDPKDPEVWVKILDLDGKDGKRIKKRTKAYKAQHKEVLNALTWKEVRALADYGRCSNDWCKTCKSSVPLVKQLKAAYKAGDRQRYLPLRSLQ